MLMQASLSGVIVALVIYSTIGAPAENDVDSTITKNISENQQSSPDNSAQVGCVCMPFYLCTSTNTSVGENYGEGVIDIKIKGGECSHYMDKCCSIPPPEQVKPPPHPQPFASYTPKCGNLNINGVGFKISGSTDNEANYGEFPWMVALLRRDQANNEITPKGAECGGSIIHPQVVLTGAHCVKRKNNVYVRAGEWDTKTDKELYPVQEREVKTVIIHEEYYAGGLYNDIALLVLESPFLLSDVVDTICLPENGEIMDGRRCIVSGWGKDAFGNEGKSQEILKRVELPIVPREPCEASLRTTKVGQNFNLHESFLCAGGEIGNDVCKGDGGGPLVCPSKEDPNKYMQAGIVSWGVGCGIATPAVYVNVPHFRSWIDDKLRANNFTQM